MIMSAEDIKIISYQLDEKTYKSLYIQFQREYIQSIVLYKLLEELNRSKN